MTNGKVHVFVGSVFPHVDPQLGFIGGHKVRQAMAGSHVKLFKADPHAKGAEILGP